MKVVHPSELMREAATVLEPVRDDVVIIGAVAVQVALDGHDVALTPTRDIDAGVKTAVVQRVVDQLEASGLARSDVPHERSFTWVRRELKVQLLRPFDPFPKGSAKGLPENNIVTELDRHRVGVAFDDTPGTLRLWAASVGALVGLKEAAFGRTRPGGARVDRDFSDAAMLLDRLVDEITEELKHPSPMRGRALRAAERLLTDEASQTAARELVKAGEHDTQHGGEIAVRRAALTFLRRMA